MHFTYYFHEPAVKSEWEWKEERYGFVLCNLFIPTPTPQAYKDLIYSGTSDSRLSKIGTPYDTKDIALGPKNYFRYSFNTPLKEDNLSIMDKTAEFMCPLFRGSTVYIHMSTSLLYYIQSPIR